MEALADYLQFVLMPQMFNGLTIGVAVILMALGLTIIFGLLDVFNMAHGEFYALGAYLGVTLASRGVQLWALLVVVPLVLLPVELPGGPRADPARVPPEGAAHAHDAAHLRARHRDGGPVPGRVRREHPQARLPLQGGTELLGNFFPTYRLFLVGFGTVTIPGVWLIVNRTRFGAMVRAAALDRHMAASLGVPVQRVYSITFAFGVALAGLSGVLLSPIYSVFPTMGKDFILMAFTAVILGGFGSIRGVVLGGLALTQIQAISSLYVSPVWGDPIVFGIMVLVLYVRPQGISGAGLDTLDPAVALERAVRARVVRVDTRSVQSRLAQVFFIVALVFAAVAVPLGDTFFLRLGTEALIFSGLAMSVDLLLGYTGMLSLGQALYFGIGRTRRRSSSST